MKLDSYFNKQFDEYVRYSVRWILVMMSILSCVQAADSDLDGLDDSVETNTGNYVSATDTGTDPANPDTDDDGVNDGLELQWKTDPTKVDSAGWRRVATQVHRADLLRSTEGVFHTNNWYSLNGVDWLPISYPPHNYWINASGYGGGTFVLTGAVGQIWTSNDFNTLTARHPGGEDILDVVYGNGIFVARKFWTTGGLWVSSNQGQSWSSADTGSVPHRGPYNHIAFGNGVFVRPAETGVKISSDGFAWSTITPSNTPAGFRFYGRIYYSTSTGFVMSKKTAALNGDVTITTASSIDGLEWKFTDAVVTTANAGEVELSGFAGDLLFVNSYESGRDLTEVWCSADKGNSWRLLEAGPWTSTINDSAYFCGNQSVLAVGTGLEIHTMDLSEFKNRLNGSIPRFQIIKGAYTWQGAKADAEARGGRLAVLSTKAKIDQVNTLLQAQGAWTYLWIGAEKAAGSSNWFWMNGSTLETNNWGIGEPNGSTSLTLNPMIWSSADAQPLKWSDEQGSALSISYLLENFVTLTAPSVINGSITGTGEYDIGAATTLTATPHSGYLFSGWTGDASGTENSLTITMDANKTVGATFVEDSRDPDNDGLTNYQEIVVRLTNPNLADTDGDGVNDGAEVQQGRSPRLAEAVVSNLVATQRTGTKFFDITYDLASTTSTVKISLEISSDGGVTYAVPVTSASGAIGEGIAVGTGKSMTWNAGVDWDGKLSSQMRFRLIADNQIINEMSLIPAGSFTMGRSSGDTDSDAPPVTVTVSGFYMGKYEVTKALWDEVRTWAVANGYTDLAVGDGKADNHPVQTVSWWDVVKWCNARSEKEGFTPCYTVSGAVMKTGTTEPTVHWTANGYRLPTEAEWEKAARGGVSGKRFPWGTDTISHNEANFENVSLSYQTGTTGYNPTYSIGGFPYTSPVGSFAPNGFGLQDVSGNVWEWCWDWKDFGNYAEGAINPRGVNSGIGRVLRGGSWINLPYSGSLGTRCCARGNLRPETKNWDMGFRIARSSGVGALASKVSTDTNLDTRMWTVSTSPTLIGTLTGGGLYLSQTNATITATANLGYLFDKWTGDASGTSNPLTITMNTNKTVGATFVEDSRDPDNDGLTNYQEIITHGSNPDLADTDGDGYSDGYEVQFSTDPKLSSSVPTFILTLSNNGSDVGGSFAMSGNLVPGTNATVTATAKSGYLFGSWTGDASGTSNPLSLLMNSNKTVGATFVEDSRDPDSDGLTNYQEIVVRLTNPHLADTDGDGVNDGQEITNATNPLVSDTDGDGLSDGEEITFKTHPLLADTDSDGLGDGDEITISKTNPLLADTNGNGINDALEDTDGDGISSGREVNELGTNPLLADSNANGLSDTYELVYQGDSEPFKPRVGDRVRYDFNRLGFNGRYSLVGKLPTGLTFNATTGILAGKITGKAGISLLTIQVYSGTTLVRSIPLSLPVLAFPTSLAGSWQALVENDEGQPEGMIRVVITSPGLWSASYDGMGTRTLRSSSGQLDLTAATEQATWNIAFPPTKASKTAPSLPAVTMTMSIDGATARAEGEHVRGSLRGFRLARGAELPAATKTFTLIIDHGEHDGFQIPAGMGTATGTLSNTGMISLAGRFGDAQIFKASFSLGATGQALIWLKPYKNVNSYIGGLISLKEAGFLPPSPLHDEESRLVWYRAADATELAYPGGFAALNASVGVREHRVPMSSIALSQNLGLPDQVIRGVVFDGGGLPDAGAQAKLPESFAMDAKYNLIALPKSGSVMAPWSGVIAAKTGGFSGSLGVVASHTGIMAGSAPVSGVLFPTLGSKIVGAGLVKIPISGRVGEFRTGAIILGTDK